MRTFSSGLEAGTYRLGFSTGSGEYLREYWNDAATLAGASDIAVGADALVSGKDAQLTAASHIAGTVTGPGGAGLSGVSVSAYRQVPGTAGWTMVDDVWASTDIDGTYDLGGLAAGTYRIGFSTWSGEHLSEFWNDAASVESATDIVLGEDATVGGRNAELATASHITGTVTGPDNVGLANVDVSAYQRSAGRASGCRSACRTQTDSTGAYDVGGLKAGTYRIGFSTWSTGHIAEYWNDAASVETATDITVGPGATVAGKDAQLAEGSHIIGTVTGTDGSGLQGIGVMAYQKTAGSTSWTAVMGSSTSTNANGDYDLGGLKAGTYRIGFSTWGTGHIPEYWNDAASVEAATDIVVGASTTVSDRNAQLAAGSHITGRVTGIGWHGAGGRLRVGLPAERGFLEPHQDGDEHRRSGQLRPGRVEGRHLSPRVLVLVHGSHQRVLERRGDRAGGDRHRGRGELDRVGQGRPAASRGRTSPARSPVPTALRCRA